jgi:hypothetical protein
LFCKGFAEKFVVCEISCSEIWDFVMFLADFVCFWWKWLNFGLWLVQSKKFERQKIKYFYSQVFCTCWMQYIMFWFWENWCFVCYSHEKSHLDAMYVGNENCLGERVACILFNNYCCMHFKKKFDISWSGLRVIRFLK